MGPSCPVEDTMTLLSRTLGSMHICVSWFKETRVQLVTAPPTYGPFAGSSRITKSSTAVALKSLMLGACRSMKTSEQSDQCLMDWRTLGESIRHWLFCYVLSRVASDGGMFARKGYSGWSLVIVYQACTIDKVFGVGKYTLRTLERRVDVKRAACLMTTWSPSSS